MLGALQLDCMIPIHMLNFLMIATASSIAFSISSDNDTQLLHCAADQDGAVPLHSWHAAYIIKEQRNGRTTTEGRGGTGTTKKKKRTAEEGQKQKGEAKRERTSKTTSELLCWRAYNAMDSSTASHTTAD